MEDMQKLKDDFKRYAKDHASFMTAVNRLNQHKVNISKKIEVLERKGFDVSKNEKNRQVYNDATRLYSLIRDMITESSKSLIFIDEFIDRISNEEHIVREEIAALESSLVLAHKVVDFEKYINTLLYGEQVK